MITVQNIKTFGRPMYPWHVYIGRACYGMEQSPLHNPPEFSRYGREGAIAKFKVLFHGHLLSRPHPGSIPHQVQKECGRLRALHEEHGKLVLICWCAPLACHGDIIKAYLEQGSQPS